jgi:hypothetical protein
VVGEGSISGRELEGTVAIGIVSILGDGNAEFESTVGVTISSSVPPAGSRSGEDALGSVSVGLQAAIRKTTKTRRLIIFKVFMLAISL